MTPERWGELREIFGEAIEIPAEGRARFLDSACGDDREMRSEIERLLAAGEEPSLESPAAGLFILPAELAPGDTLAHYRIQAKLGAGGMGVVYRAADTRLQRSVALKVLPPEHLADPERRKRLMREARAASALNHPNIVTVYEIGNDRGFDFISMEYVAGRRLADVIGSGLRVPQALDYAIAIADALSKAHAEGVIHRDLKPANIMLAADGRIKILDFGLARRLRAAASGTVTLTAEGEITGTPHYMSPEQARGIEVDARSDIFSLGVVIYEMLAGRRPFEGDTPSYAILCILEKPPLPLTRYLPDAPPELQRILAKALEKQPSDRYASAKDLVLDIQRLRQVFPAPASRTPAFLRSKTVGIAALVAVLAAAALSFYVQRSPSLTARDTILLADFQNTTSDAAFDDTLKQGLAIQLEQSPFLNFAPDTQVRDTLRYMGRSPDERITSSIGRDICQRLGLKLVVAGSVAPLGSHYVVTLQAINAVSGDAATRVQTEAPDKEHVLSALGEAGRQLRHRLGESLPSIARYDAPLIQATTSSLEALQAYSMGERAFRKGAPPRTVLLYRQRAVELDPNFALAYKSLSMTYLGLQTEHARSVEAATKAFELRNRTTELERLMIEAHYYRFVTHEDNRALQALETAAQAYPRSAILWNNLGAVYNNLGRFDESVSAHRKELALVPSPTSHALVASNLFYANRFSEAKNACHEADAQNMGTPFCHDLLFQMAAFEGNESAMQQEIAWSRAHSAPVYNEWLWARERAEFQGKFKQAGEIADKAIQENARRNAKSPTILEALAFDHAIAGQCRQSGEYGRAALDSPNTRNGLLTVGFAATVCGETDRALALADQVDKVDPGFGLHALAYPHVMRAMVKTPSESEPDVPDELIVVNRGPVPFDLAYFRAEVLMRRHKPAEAADQFQDIVYHRWRGPLSVLYPLSYLGLARAAAALGDIARSRKAYESFFALWKDGDPDMPTLLTARAEYVKLAAAR